MNKNTRRLKALTRKQCKSGAYQGEAPVRFGTCINSSALREASGKKPYACFPK